VAAEVVTACPGVAPWLAGCLFLAVTPALAAAPAPARQQELVRMVRQDCGSCHGLRLTGGLGPALTRAALIDRPLDSLTATIQFGRPGTPMPPWRSMLSDDEAQWIAARLVDGFPELPARSPR
jgi:cytochrome c55X